MWFIQEKKNFFVCYKKRIPTAAIILVFEPFWEKKY